MTTALYVGETRGHLVLPHVGYVDALRRWGWNAVHMSIPEGAQTDPREFDLILWNGPIDERFLARVGSAQTLVAMNGAGDDISYYLRHRGKIALATTSLFYFDEPGLEIKARHLNPKRMISRQYVWLTRYMRRFPRFASPRFWRDLGTRLLYLPFASDPAVFYPLPHVDHDLVWSFVGHIRERVVIKRLMEASRAQHWNYAVHSPETGNPLDPSGLNRLYNRTRVGVNEHHRLLFGRELNERTFDLGMAGLIQVSDMGWLAAPVIGPFGCFYSGNIASRGEVELAVALLQSANTSMSRDAVHGFFKRWHSFEARLATLSAALGQDLSQGRVSIKNGIPTVNGIEHVPFIM